MTILFIFNSILLGAGLAMDAFSVSVADALAEPDMKKSRMSLIAGTFAFFQFLMPMIGWVCVHTIVTLFSGFQKFIPYIAFILLCFIGGKMIFECIRDSKRRKKCDACERACDESCEQYEEKTADRSVRIGTLLVQGIATSIDALSVGFAIAEYTALSAFLASLIIAGVTFLLCIIGLFAGKKLGRFLKHAGIIGGVILILIGIEIFAGGF